MSLSVVAAPDAESDLVVILSLLEAHDIPTYVHNAGLSGLFPGLQINAFNSRRVMVPTEYAEAAMQALSLLPTEPIQPAPLAQRAPGILRVLVELIFTGWFVPRHPSRFSGKDS